MSKSEFLYGYEGAESLNDEPEDVAEYLWDSAAEESDGPFLVEKWTVAPQRSHLPESFRVLDFVGEWTSENGEVDEGFDDHLMNLLADPEVVAQMEATLDFIAARIGYRMADKLVETETWWHRNGKFVRDEIPTGPTQNRVAELLDNLEQSVAAAKAAKASQSVTTEPDFEPTKESR